MNNEFKAQRNEAFETGDISWARNRLPEGTNDRVVEAAFHKARFHCLDTSEGKRIESRNWLCDRGLHDMNGKPINAATPLPT